MDLWVLDSNFKKIDIIDNYISLIWTERYSEAGEFELFSDLNEQILKLSKIGNYISISDSDRLMIIEKYEITTDIEDGDRITVSGRTVDTILDRRIVWGLRTLNDNIEDAIKFLLSDNAISPSNTNRIIPNFIFKKTDDIRIRDIKIKTQITGANLYETIKNLCNNEQLGFKVILNSNNKLEFSLFKGIDRSRKQTINNLVIFSEQFDNLLNSNYIDNVDNYKNAALIGGEGEGIDRIYSEIGTESGLERRELFVDARDISSQTENQNKSSDGKNYNTSMPIAEYKQLLNARGYEKLAETTKTEAFEGEVDIHSLYKYNEDFFIGDIVQLENRYGFSTQCMVTEYVISVDENGINAYPTFTNVNKIRKD